MYVKLLKTKNSALHHLCKALTKYATHTLILSSYSYSFCLCLLLLYHILNVTYVKKNNNVKLKKYNMKQCKWFILLIKHKLWKDKDLTNLCVYYIPCSELQLYIALSCNFIHVVYKKTGIITVNTYVECSAINYWKQVE